MALFHLVALFFDEQHQDSFDRCYLFELINHHITLPLMERVLLIVLNVFLVLHKLYDMCFPHLLLLGYSLGNCHQKMNLTSFSIHSYQLMVVGRKDTFH